jgi:hypothetical protein
MSLLGMVGVGCSNDTPHEYGQQRPDINQLSPDDSGLQSKDVEACTSQMIQELVSSPALQASPTQWTMVVTNVDDQTTDKSFNTNYDIFIESLRASISQKAAGRIQLIENKDKFHSIRDKEIEGSSDPYKQGGGPGTGAPAAINPDYGLYAKAFDMPNRSTNFYMLEFDVTNLQNRMQVWTRTYKVKVAR